MGYSEPSGLSAYRIVFWLRHPFAFSWQLMALVALSGQLRTNDDPRYSSLSTNLLNPWATWCNQQFLSCYGTSWAHWGGPYSVLWYWTNTLLSLNGVLPLTLVFYMISLAVQFRLRSSWLGFLWAMNSFFALIAWPQNFMVVAFIFLGFYRKIGLIIAPLWKLPLFAPNWVWTLVLTSDSSARDSINWPVYLWLAILWLSVLAWHIYRRKPHPTSRAPVQEPEIPEQSAPSLRSPEREEEEESG
jgi:hypothetical protein